MILIHLLFVSIFTKNPIFLSFLLNNIENNIIAYTELDNYKCIQMYMYEFLYPQWTHMFLAGVLLMISANIRGFVNEE